MTTAPFLRTTDKRINTKHITPPAHHTDYIYLQRYPSSVPKDRTAKQTPHQPSHRLTRYQQRYIYSPSALRHMVTPSPDVSPKCTDIPSE